MDPTDAAACSIARTLDVVGEKWTFLILREVFRGVRRFDDVRVATGAPRQVLSERLASLVDRGILRREPYREPGQRPRHEYRLTDRGFDLYPILIAMLAWGDRHLPAPDGPALRAAHRDCDADVRIALRCEAGHEVAALRDVVPRPGPGARRAQTVAGSSGSRV